ncbi:hypothetical protein BC826DRAFT_7516 [Russula brevipes]|nr:hypothetical protein BC826DRAFT_7516 [Russula brevipes]
MRLDLPGMRNRHLRVSTREHDVLPASPTNSQRGHPLHISNPDVAATSHNAPFLLCTPRPCIVLGTPGFLVLEGETGSSDVNPWKGLESAHPAVRGHPVTSGAKRPDTWMGFSPPHCRPYVMSETILNFLSDRIDKSRDNQARVQGSAVIRYSISTEEYGFLLLLTRAHLFVIDENNTPEKLQPS